MMSGYNPYHDDPTQSDSFERKRSRGGSEGGDHAAAIVTKQGADDYLSQPPQPFVNLPFYGEHKRAVSSVKLAPSRLTPDKQHGAICASASSDGTVKVWDVSATGLSNSVNNANATGSAHPTTSSSTTGDVATPSSTGDNNTFNNNNNHHKQGKTLLQPLSTLVGHARGINDVAWSPDAPMVVTASDDKTLRLWDAVTSDPLVEFRGHDNFVFCCEIYQNLLVSGSFDETVKLWDCRSGECVSTLPVHSDPVTAVSFNRDGTCLTSASHDGLIRIWDVATGECLKTIFAAGNPPVSHVTYSPNGKYILAGTLDSKVRLWNVSQRGSNKCTKTYSDSKNHANHKYCIVSDFVTARPDRQCIVTGSETGKLILYDINSRQVHQVLEGHADAVLAVDAHDKHELIASGGMTHDRTVQFWAPQNSPLAVMTGATGNNNNTSNNGDAKRVKR